MARIESIENDVAVSRSVHIGGQAVVKGSCSVGHDLRVEGWLDAPNIKGCCKGLFETSGDLKAAYPEPEAGWFAGVGTAMPADLYMASGGKWKLAGGTMAVSIAPDKINKQLEALDTKIEAVEASIPERGSLADAASVLGVQEAMKVVQGDIKDMLPKVAELESAKAIGEAAHASMAARTAEMQATIATLSEELAALRKLTLLALMQPAGYFKNMVATAKIEDEECPVSIAEGEMSEKIYYAEREHRFAAKHKGRYYSRWNEGGEAAYNEAGSEKPVVCKLYVRSDGMLFMSDVRGRLRGVYASEGRPMAIKDSTAESAAKTTIAMTADSEDSDLLHAGKAFVVGTEKVVVNGVHYYDYEVILDESGNGVGIYLEMLEPEDEVHVEAVEC